ncbi:pilus assembly PilX family protein [Vreelandella sp. TE19]
MIWHPEVSPERPARQQGAALAVVMVVLASALMLGIVGVQSALIDQRQAANYRAALKAQMRAETAAVEALSTFDTLDWENAPTLAPDQRLRFPVFSQKPGAVHRCRARSCVYLPVIRNDEHWVMALGVVYAHDDARASLIAHSEPVFVRVEGDEGAGQRRWE